MSHDLATKLIVGKIMYKFDKQCRFYILGHLSYFINKYWKHLSFEHEVNRSWIFAATLIILKPLYKITEIVRVLWLAERSVYMRVCKHGCDVRCFAFRALITQARIWIPSPAETWKIFTIKLSHLFFRLSWHFKREKSVFWKHLFAIQELITRARLRVQDFATGKNFSFNHRHNKEFCVFSQKSNFIKAIENFFPVFA